MQLSLMSRIHMGGTYGDKEATLARFKENYTTRLSERVKARLVLENDEVSGVLGWTIIVRGTDPYRSATTSTTSFPCVTN